MKISITNVDGFLKAFDAETGKLAWTRYAVPAPGEKGSETWPQTGEWKDAWKKGGGEVVPYLPKSKS